MKRHKRHIGGALLVLLLSASACDRGVVPTGPDDSPRPISAASHASDTEYLGFRPPLGPDEYAQDFDASFLPYLTVSICEWSGEECVGAPVAELTADGVGQEQLRIEEDEGGQYYLVVWKADVESDRTYRIRVMARDVVLGWTEIETGKGKGRVNPGRALSIKFWIEREIPGARVVGPAGGVLNSQDNALQLTIPSGALDEPHLITIGIVPHPGPVNENAVSFVGPIYQLEPSGLSFDEPSTIAYTIPHAISTPEDLILWRVDFDREWFIWNATTIVNRLASTGLDRFSYWVPAVAKPLFKPVTYDILGPPQHTENFPAFDAVQRSIEWAFDAWDAQLLDITFTRGGADDADIQVFFGDLVEEGIGNASDNGGALLRCVFTVFDLCFADGSGTRGFVVQDRADKRWFAEEDYFQTQLQGLNVPEERTLYHTAIHELGHNLGLDHTRVDECAEVAGREPIAATYDALIAALKQAGLGRCHSLVTRFVMSTFGGFLGALPLSCRDLEEAARHYSVLGRCPTEINFVDGAELQVVGSSSGVEVSVEVSGARGAVGGVVVGFFGAGWLPTEVAQTGTDGVATVELPELEPGEYTLKAGFLNSQSDTPHVVFRQIDIKILELDINEGLIAHYPLNGNANDATGNGHDGVVNGATATADRSGTAGAAMSFDGGDYISTPFAPTYEVADPFSIAFWFQTNHGGIQLKAYGLEVTNRQEISIGVDPDGTLLGFVRDDGLPRAHTSARSPQAVNDGVWHHAALVRDPSADKVRLYVDGVLVDGRTDATATPINASNTRPFSIGATNNSSFGFRHRWIGKLDDLRVYDRVLDESEIELLANGG